MKKFSLFLLVLFVWGSFSGVGFAAGPALDQTMVSDYESPNPEPPEEVSPENGQCPMGYKSVGSPPICSSWDGFCAGNNSPGASSYDANYSVYDASINASACITVQERCDATTGMKWHENQCMTLSEYCPTQKQEYDQEDAKCVPCASGETFDQTTKTCFDPNVTPSTIIPNTKIQETDCEKLFKYDAYEIGYLKSVVRGGVKVDAPEELKNLTEANMISPLDVLGCAIKTGRIRLWMIPFYIKYLIQLALSLAGLVAVGAVVLGGYFYLFGAFADDKDKGKRSIIYGIVGFIIAMLSWTIVNIVMMILTR
ncbi:hypothetical protein HOG17_03680 [Candidatus Peregrinibacteria bacterium]|jgi:hypothetical protein|nr:hypothetical protein [Candidatus Peregrinibacteria bacterium]MBT4148304.1 hypothetical protein [Candidatus Peregrinibacteria bacterium]MBT4366441.1 hypothetical protein [Candidatus Peregrinibacteria bacterium]MBT4455943.1 hypothetical protein [Candidatus Peregrinibacteria bacterium]